jgi:hypothetical protein
VTPIEQTITELGKGNCVAACIASILELPIDRMPNFHGGGWYHAWADWLAPANLTLTELSIEHGAPRGFSILAADSPRNPVLHAVVVSGRDVVWDPHPRRDMGIGEGRMRWLVHALDPRLPVDLSALVLS